MRWLVPLLALGCGSPSEAIPGDPCRAFAGDGISDTCDGDLICVERVCVEALPRRYGIRAVGGAGEGGPDGTLTVLLGSRTLGTAPTARLGIVEAEVNLSPGDALTAVLTLPGQEEPLRCTLDAEPESLRKAVRTCSDAVGGVELVVWPE